MFFKSKILNSDLKVDNIMFDLEGHIRLIDFGISKEGMDRGATTQTFCGTPDYIAPEVNNKMFWCCNTIQMILTQDYSFAVDWWAFGVVIFEVLTGTVFKYVKKLIVIQSPFEGYTETVLFDNILKSKICIPTDISGDGFSIIAAVNFEKSWFKLFSF